MGPTAAAEAARRDGGGEVVRGLKTAWSEPRRPVRKKTAGIREGQKGASFFFREL